jgi:nucleotide-binding universal stress UspA family protein
VEAQLSVGLVVDEIARSARELKADIVVVGVKKRGWLARLLNSTTGRALRRVNCPILAVPAPQRNIGGSVIRRDLTRLVA